MNLDQLQKELAADEGCKLEIYLDHLGYPRDWASYSRR